MDARAFKEWLRSEALASGFAKAGFASCEAFDSEAAHLRTWFAEGGAEHLPYLEEETLRDPRNLWPEAKTALVGFFPYARPEAVPGAAPGSLKLSRYLWGTDYHILMKPRLARLLEAAQARWPGLAGRVCVDTAPILERQLAVRAGLGWQGKHTLLIMGKAGSYGFLGVLLLSVELPPDEPFKTLRADLRRAQAGGPPGTTMTTEHCGSCTRCLEVCPGGAISPFRLDPNRCLTTWTIETEAEPPPDLAEAIQSSRWAAGCDACQEACPWNTAPVWGDAALWGQPNRLHEQPAASLRLGSAQWRVRTRRTALRRVRVQHWRRTVELILGPGPRS